MPCPSRRGRAYERKIQGERMFIYIVWAFIGELPPFSTR
jgi:hypothetical protein